MAAKVGGLLGGELPGDLQDSAGLLSVSRPRQSGAAMGQEDEAAQSARASGQTARPTAPRRALRMPSELRDLRLNFVGPDVRGLQQRLNRRERAGLEISGRFEQATHEAVVRFQNAQLLTPHGTVTKEVWFKLLSVNERGESPTDPINPLVPEWSLTERFERIIEAASESRPEWRQGLSGSGHVVNGLVALTGETIFGRQDVFTIAESKLPAVPPAERFEIANIVDRLLQVVCRAASIHDIETGVVLFTDTLETTGLESFLDLLEHREPTAAAEVEGEPTAEPEPIAQGPGVREEEALEEIHFRLLDQEGNSLAGAKYKIEMPDGNTVTGTISEDGWVDFYDVPPGDCSISFSDLLVAGSDG